MKLEPVEHTLLSLKATTYDLSGAIDNKVLAKDVLKYENNRLNNNPNSTSYEDTILPVTEQVRKLFHILDIVANSFAPGLKEQLDTKEGPAGSHPKGGHWGHICRPGVSTMVHSHAGGEPHSGAVLSWCYYVSYPKNGGPLTFQLSHSPFRDFMIEITPKTGLLIFFPGWINHLTKINTSNQVRISIAGNYNLEGKHGDQQCNYLRTFGANEKLVDFMGPQALGMLQKQLIINEA